MNKFSILDQRIVWPSFVYQGDAQLAVEKLLNDNVIAPGDPSRKINGIVFERNDNLPHREVHVEFSGTNLSDALKAVCAMDDLVLFVREKHETNQVIIKCGYPSQFEEVVG